jgi:translation elongation factor EF-Tu-like GTPase
MFRMTVADVFYIRGRGIVASGRIEEGEVRVGDEVRVNDEPLRVDGIEVSRNTVNEARAGEAAGLLFANVDKSRIKRGNIITAAG